MKKIVYTGIGSRVGKALEKHGVSLLDCDVTQVPQVEQAIADARPDVIAHLAAKSNVNWCEENQPQTVAVNFRGAVNVFRAAYALDIPVVALSTEHIFDGKLGNYREESKDKFKNPVNYYGMSKLAMEAAAQSFPNVKIVRSSTLFNAERDLIRQYLEPLKNGEKVFVPDFIMRSFMYVPHFAEMLSQYSYNFDGMPKVLNLAGSMNVSWYYLVSYMASVYKIDRDMVRPRSMEDKTFGSSRPMKGGLNIRRAVLLGFRPPSYMDGLRQMKEDETLRELGYND